MVIFHNVVTLLDHRGTGLSHLMLRYCIGCASTGCACTYCVSECDQSTEDVEITFISYFHNSSSGVVALLVLWDPSCEEQ